MVSHESQKLTREALRQVALEAIETVPQRIAAWEGGSAATGYLDQYSDIDFQLVVEDGATANAWDHIEQCVATLAQVRRSYGPDPLAGQTQKFLLLEGAAPWHMIDILVIEQHAFDTRWLVRERHGDVLILFDRRGILSTPEVDSRTFAEQIHRDLRQAVDKARMYAHLVDVYLARGYFVDALDIYRSAVLPAVRVALGATHRPWKYDFTRYLHRDLDPETVQRFQSLAYIRSPDEMPARVAEALSWLDELTGPLSGDPSATVAALEAQRVR